MRGCGDGGNCCVVTRRCRARAFCKIFGMSVYCVFHRQAVWGPIVSTVSSQNRKSDSVHEMARMMSEAVFQGDAAVCQREETVCQERAAGALPSQTESICARIAPPKQLFDMEIPMQESQG